MARYRPPRPLNLGVYKEHDVVRHYRHGTIFVVLGGRWRSELLNVFNAETGEREIIHPLMLDLEDEGMVVLAALHAL